jgi:hypothetical protein
VWSSSALVWTDSGIELLHEFSLVSLVKLINLFLVRTSFGYLIDAKVSIPLLFEFEHTRLAEVMNVVQET